MAQPLLEECAIDELIDSRLGSSYKEHEVYCMLHAASLCIRQDPQTRPRMSQVLRILEGLQHLGLMWEAKVEGFCLITSWSMKAISADQAIHLLSLVQK
ncbi:hypothetical protein RND71_004525 [Anisodus tanguticus]|uniref:Uncharacterized protein n=1 Tax=Anisodus tanguticus TaxID=243964 RepID=A0AAE1SQP8_9SOLA|nr:hypothetical protein RND71_004525 [Anisodus tanguticus]